jgi:PKD repeat protein
MYDWDFGDGNTSTLQNPEYTYLNTGVYTVTLKVTNERGDSTLVKTDYVKVNEKPDLPEGEKLYGGNMEDPNLWNISHLDTEGHETVTWNSTDNTMMHGEGGNLHIKGPKDAVQSQYCIWQEVEMHKDSVYHFDAAFKAVQNPQNGWVEVFIGTVAPVDGSDYGADSIRLVYFNTWAACNAADVDGTFMLNGCVDQTEFRPEVSGTYYFVLKVGCQGGGLMEVAIDEVSLQESTFIPAPAAEFFADVTTGDAPLTVFFTDLSTNATSWYWDFGDGNTSTDQSPSHTYSTPGTYTVTQVAIAGELTDTNRVTDLITVGSTSVSDVNQAGLKVYPNPSSGTLNITMTEAVSGTLEVTDLTGRMILRRELFNESHIRIEIEEKGMYLLNIQSTKYKGIIKAIIK